MSRLANEEKKKVNHSAKKAGVLMYAAEKGLHRTCLPPQLALALARAARGITLAEQETAKLRIKECEDLLETPLQRRCRRCTCARVHDAQRQVASLLVIFDREGIHVVTEGVVM